MAEGQAVKAGDTPTSHPLFRSGNRLKLGSFSWNLQGGGTATLAEGVITQLNWPQQVRIAKASEAAGFDAIVPVGRWKGIGGKSNFWGESYETMAWASALATATERVTLFATVHVPLLHPVRAAKAGVTIDHISDGRFGFNMVAGWNAAEFDMFGKRQLPHDERYAEAAEWADFIKRLWREEKPFDWEGKYYQSPGAHSEPRPLRSRPLLMSAGSSPAGQAFAARNVDIIFITPPTDLDQLRGTVAGIKQQAAAVGRQVQVWTTGGMLCCPTEAEVQRRFNYFVHEKGDWEGAELLRQAIMGGGQATSYIDQKTIAEGMIAWSHGYRLMGTPEQVVGKMNALSDAGLDGMALIWVDFEEGLDVFAREIKPLAQQTGLMSASV